MAGYIGSKASVVSNGAERKKVFDITTTTTSLTGCSYTPNQVHIFHNGVRLVDGTDYTATDGSTVTLTTAAQSGDEVVVVSYATFQPADAYTKTESDDRFVNVTGDTMTGALTVNKGSAGTLATFTDGVNSNFVVETASLITTVGNTGGSTALAFKSANTERMRIDASGRVTMPYQPAFWAVSSTYSASGNYPFTNFTLSAGMFNRGNHLNLTTGVFTAPIAGIYHFNGVWNDTANSTSRKIGRFQLNGSSLGEFAEATDQYADIGASIVISMAANDTMQVITHPLAFGGCNFSGYLIG